MDKKMIIAVVITLVVAGGVGFYGGTLYSDNARANLSANFMGQRGANMMGQRAGGAGQGLCKTAEVQGTGVRDFSAHARGL